MSRSVVRSCFLVAILSAGCSLPVDEFQAPVEGQEEQEIPVVSDSGPGDEVPREPAQHGKKPKVRGDD